MAELVDALDSKSSMAHPMCRFESGLRYKSLIMFTVFAIKSLIHKFIYVGMTEKLEERLVRHNKGYVRSTKRFAPFKLIYSEICESGKLAREREKFLKSTSGKRFLKSLIENKSLENC